MTTPHAPDDADDERLPGEDELSSLYRKLPPVEPPAALDAAVRRAAAEAVKPPVAARRRTRWPVALSSAAALVVAAGLAWRMGHTPSRQDELREATAQHEAQTIAAQEQPKADREPAAVPPSPSLQAPPKIISVPEPPKQPPPSYARVRQEKAQDRNRQMAPPAPPPAVEEASSHPLQAPAVPPAPPAPPAPFVEIVGGHVDSAPSASAPVVADKVEQADRALEQIAPQQRQAAHAMKPAPMPAQAIPAPMEEETLPAPAPGIDLGFNKADTPEQELQKIRGLFTLNQRDDARKRLADFHRDHPDYTLPADLRDQLLQP